MNATQIAAATDLALICRHADLAPILTKASLNERTRILSELERRALANEPTRI